MFRHIIEVIMNAKNHRLTALFLALIITCNSPNPVYAIGDSNIDTSLPFECCVIVNEDVSFPLKVNYENCSIIENDYEFTLAFELKDALRVQSNCFALEITDELGYIVYSNSDTHSSTKIQIDTLSANTVYNYCLKTNNNIYNGKFSNSIDTDGTLVFDYNVASNEIINSNARNTSIQSETSATHSSMNTAQSINLTKILKGTLTSTSQLDFYSVECPSSITNGTIDVTLGCPDGHNYDLVLYDSNYNIIDESSSFTTSYGEFCKYSISAGDVYYIRVKAHSGSSTSASAYYYIYTAITQEKAWFSQYNGNVLDYQYWNTYNLNKLYFTGYSNSIPFKLDGSNDDIMHEGCAISSVAMVLKNAGAVTNLRIDDFRSEYYGYAEPDPFIVTLRNVSLRDKPTLDETEEKYCYDIALTNTPVELNTVRSLSALVSDFNKTLNKAEQNISIDGVIDLLNTHPEGVIVQLKSTTADFPEHWIVFCESSNTDGYIVYDPGTGQKIRGNGVSFENSYSYSKGFTLDDISTIYYLT